MTGEPDSKKMKTAYPTKPMEGHAVPSVHLRARKGGQWWDINTGDFFKGKTVVALALPGAFTPTCSSTHLPRYEQLYDCFKKVGVDEICCISVNDGFVMDAWLKDQKIKHVVLLPDGNYEFTEQMGMLCDKSALGFGKRSWRYSMLVKDGIIEKIFAEPVQEGDPFEVSDADTMMKYLDPNFKAPPATLMFTKQGCSFCEKARKLLNDKKIAFEEVEVGLNGTVSLTALRAVSTTPTTPRVFMDGKLIGGADDLEKYLKNL